jgi:hypothetical protein
VQDPGVVEAVRMRGGKSCSGLANVAPPESVAEPAPAGIVPAHRDLAMDEGPRR